MRRLVLIASLAAAIAAVTLPARGAADDAPRPVRVMNWPAVQKVEGKVVVDKPVPHATLVTLGEIAVPPIEPGEIGRHIDGGILEADGYTAVVLRLTGRTGGRGFRSGSIGAYLVPDEPEVNRALEQDSQMLFPIEINAPLNQTAFRMLASNQSRHTLGFPRYRVRLYNTTDKVVNATLYAYLTN
jgi:hypothetical protein